jgi:hypothetical protein
VNWPRSYQKFLKMDQTGDMKKLVQAKKIPLIQYQGDGKDFANGDFSLF